MPDKPRRILLVSWYFPPSDEIAGKVVWRLARHLALAGCDVHVLLPPLGEVRNSDDSFARDMPANLRITRTSVGVDPVRVLLGWRQRLKQGRTPSLGQVGGDVSEPERKGSRRLLLEAVQMLPDRARHWIAPARRALQGILRDERPDLLISVAPMLSAHLLVARTRPRRYGVRWLAWSHDPDMLNPYRMHLPDWRNRIVERWEKRALRTADQLLVTTQPMADAYALQLPDIAMPVVLPCGYDPDEMPSEAAEARPGDCLVVAHVGTVYGHRSPLPLLESLARLVANGDVQMGQLLVRFIGKMENAEGRGLAKRIHELGLEAMVEVGGVVSQAEALAVIRDAHVGLVLAERQPLQVPAKLFEYIGLRRPMFVLGDGATTDLVSRLGVGFACERDGLDDTLRQMLASWRSDRLASQRRNLAGAASRYAMPAIAAGLLDFIDTGAAPMGEAA